MRLPKIVGYLVAGVVLGPAGLDVVTLAATERLAVISQLAIALIAFLAGAELQWREVRGRGRQLVGLVTVELSIAFVAIAALVYTLASTFAVIPDPTHARVLAFSLLFSSIAIVHSPAITVAMLAETGARGPVARTTLGVVLISDVFVLLLFTAMLWVATSIVPAGDNVVGVAGVAWKIGGGMAAGGLVGLAVVAYLRFVGRWLMPAVIAIAVAGVVIARLAQVDLLLSMLVAGFIAENLSVEGERLRTAMLRTAAPIFIAFFALAGASIAVRQLIVLLPFVLPIAIVRGLAIRFGMRLGSRWIGATSVEREYAWLGLISQAGVAIGLATVAARAFPAMGAELSALLLALIAVNESVGPILFRRALVASGEIEEDGQTQRRQGTG